MSTLTCWLSTSPTKNVLWLKDKSGLLKGNPFLNLESNAARDILVEVLREAFARGTSFEVIVDVRDIQTRKDGTMSVKADLDTILTNMVETVKVESKPISNDALAKAEALLSGLRARPVVERVSAHTEEFTELF
jgi:sugar/nucleoside kinase (ribokinase family)